MTTKMYQAFNFRGINNLSKEYVQAIAVCKQAHFVFTKQDSFTLYLEFEFGENHGTGFYLSSYAQLDEIRKMLNKNKTGMSRDSIDQEDLDKLVGKTARIQTAGLGSKCLFGGFIEELIKH